MCALLNTILKQGKFPSVWKVSNIEPIPKSNPATEVKDYRPVELTFIIARTFERLLLKSDKKRVTSPSISMHTY